MPHPRRAGKNGKQSINLHVFIGPYNVARVHSRRRSCRSQSSKSRSAPSNKAKGVHRCAGAGRSRQAARRDPAQAARRVPQPGSWQPRGKACLSQPSTVASSAPSARSPNHGNAPSPGPGLDGRPRCCECVSSSSVVRAIPDPPQKADPAYVIVDAAFWRRSQRQGAGQLKRRERVGERERERERQTERDRERQRERERKRERERETETERYGQANDMHNVQQRGCSRCSERTPAVMSRRKGAKH